MTNDLKAKSQEFQSLFKLSLKDYEVEKHLNNKMYEVISHIAELQKRLDDYEARVKNLTTKCNKLHHDLEKRTRETWRDPELECRYEGVKEAVAIMTEGE